LFKLDRSSTSLTIFSLNLAENYQPVNELYQTADHPALSPKSRDPEWRLAMAHNFKYFFLGGFFSLFLAYIIQHCFICRPSDSTVPTDAGIEPRTVATGALAVRRSNH
jgi:hypothetical protein